MAYQLKGMDPAATMKEETIQLKENNVVSQTSSMELFKYNDIDSCKFYYNKIPLSTEIENKFKRECCMVFMKPGDDKNDVSKYNWICSKPQNRCRG